MPRTDSWIKYRVVVIKRSERRKKKLTECEKQERKIHFAPRLNVTHKKNKFIICTNDIYSRDLFATRRRVSCCVFEKKTRQAIHSLSLFVSHSLPQNRRHDLRDCLINNLFSLRWAHSTINNLCLSMIKRASDRPSERTRARGKENLLDYLDQSADVD